MIFLAHLSLYLHQITNEIVTSQYLIMQIQRIQTLYLLLAIIAVILFIFMPFGYLGDMALSGQRPALLIPTCATIVAMTAAIFTFKKFSLQRTLVVLSIVAVIALIVAVVYVMTMGYDVLIENTSLTPVWSYGGGMLVIALISLIAALSRIKADHKLLRSYDRLR